MEPLWFRSRCFAFSGDSKMDWLLKIKAIAAKLLADPEALAKVRAWWTATVDIWGLLAPDVPEASPELEAALAEAIPPEKLGDGTILNLLRQISQFAQSHPELITALLALLKL